MLEKKITNKQRNILLLVSFISRFFENKKGIRTFGDELLVTRTFGDAKDLVTRTLGDAKDLVTGTYGA